MGKTKPEKKKDKKKKKEKSVLNRVAATPNPSSPLPKDLHADAQALLLECATYLQNGDLSKSVKPAQKALALLGATTVAALPALNRLGEIHVELGDIDAARTYFLQAAAVDSSCALGEDVGGGAEKFLWLAELSAEGGRDSVAWFEKGAASLRGHIERMVEAGDDEEGVEGKRRRLAGALCGVVEVYMTDLSWEVDAEARCEALVTEATMVAPGVAECWQTLASVRISQSRMEDARAALRRSLELWVDLEMGDESVPEVPARVSLARLLLEAGMEGEALGVLEQLVEEDERSVEVWYLGGWGLFILGEKQKNEELEADGEDGESWRISWISSRRWLSQSLKLFELQDYEDERLGEHAKELLASLSKELGAETADGDKEKEEDDGEEWEDENENGSSEEDEEMGGA